MRFVAVFISLLLASIFVTAQTRTFRPDDMFQLRRVGAAVWAPNGSYATIEFTKPSRWLDSVPANDLSLLDVKTRTLRSLSPKSTAYIGFFNAVWSPDSKRVAFLSLDRNAVVRAWVWTIGTAAASVVPNVEPRIGLSDPPIAWVDGDRLAVMSWELGGDSRCEHWFAQASRTWPSPFTFGCSGWLFCQFSAQQASASCVLFRKG